MKNWKKYNILKNIFEFNVIYHQNFTIYDTNDLINSASN